MFEGRQVPVLRGGRRGLALKVFLLLPGADDEYSSKRSVPESEPVDAHAVRTARRPTAANVVKARCTTVRTALPHHSNDVDILHSPSVPRVDLPELVAEIPPTSVTGRQTPQAGPLRWARPEGRGWVVWAMRKSARTRTNIPASRAPVDPRLIPSAAGAETHPARSMRHSAACCPRLSAALAAAGRGAGDGSVKYYLSGQLVAQNKEILDPWAVDFKGMLDQ